MVALNVGLRGTSSSPQAPAPNEPGWPSPLADQRALAAHLLRRAGFGYDRMQLDAAASMPYDDVVDSLVSQVAEPLPIPANVTDSSAVAQAWYRHMATTRAQFPERMTLFWHGVLTSDYANAFRLPFVYQQNVLYRAVGLTDLRSLLSAVTRDPLMMRYLDLDVSTAAAPNENYARELMELFTLGPGNYSEADVREAARAFTGLRIAFLDSHGAPASAPTYDPLRPQPYLDQITALVRGGASYAGAVVPRLHDAGRKTVLGHTGTLGADDVIDILLAQPACAPFVTRRAMTFFSSTTPSPAEVNAVATQFRNSRYDIPTLMRAIFRSDGFTAPSNYRSLVRSPTDYTVATMVALGRPDLAAEAGRSAAAMDQQLYAPPNVAGWPIGPGWVSSSTLLARINFAVAATSKLTAAPNSADAVADQLDSLLSPATAVALDSAHTESDRWFALLASPEFQLK